MPKCLNAKKMRDQVAQDLRIARLMEEEWNRPHALMFTPGPDPVIEALTHFVRSEVRRVTGTASIFGEAPHHAG